MILYSLIHCDVFTNQYEIFRVLLKYVVHICLLLIMTNGKLHGVLWPAVSEGGGAEDYQKDSRWMVARSGH